MKWTILKTRVHQSSQLAQSLEISRVTSSSRIHPYLSSFFQRAKPSYTESPRLIPSLVKPLASENVKPPTKLFNLKAPLSGCSIPLQGVYHYQLPPATSTNQRTTATPRQGTPRHRSPSRSIAVSPPGAVTPTSGPLDLPPWAVASFGLRCVFRCFAFIGFFSFGV